MGGGDRNDQEGFLSRGGTKAVVPAGKLGKGAHAKLREAIAHFFGKRTEVGDDHLRLALKSRAQCFVLRGDAHWAGIEMALARHDASDSEERRGAKAKFVRAED